MGEFLLRIFRAIFGGPVPSVDADALLTERAKAKGERLDWRNSIVDLLKVLDLDSSLAGRKELADELGYEGPLDGSAQMNVWLHAEVMKRVRSGEYRRNDRR